MAEHSLLNTTFPVFLPEMPQLHLSKAEFDASIIALLRPTQALGTIPVRIKHENAPEIKGEATGPKPAKGSESTEERKENEAPFMKGLLADKATVPSFDDRDGKMLTENADVTHRTSGNALVDLFFELEEVIPAARLRDVLEKAWEDDAEATLKIIWNARSIHLGKSSRSTFYRAVGWLAKNHPATLIVNLPWLVRPLIPKKAPKKDEKKEKARTTEDAEVSKNVEIIDPEDADSDFEVIDENGELEGQPEQKKPKLDDAGLAEFDIKFGVSHGYWKDLLNILALAVNDELTVDGNPKRVLNVEDQRRESKRDWTESHKKEQIAERHKEAVEKLENDGFYKALHLAVARLFADQLQMDLARLNSGEKAEIKAITLAGKWAPSHKGMHDQHTCIVSSIAELLHPFDSVCPENVDPADRELCLKYARIAYQSQTLSLLRKHLQIVERPITAEKFNEIRYERVPSLAMRQYMSLFAKKDPDRFDKYLDKVVLGKANISGATLLPSTLVESVLYNFIHKISRIKEKDLAVEMKMRHIKMKTTEGQWKTVVQRIKDSGTLESSIAVCDVSGSMHSPQFPDGTSPIDSSIGLSLLLAEVTKPPFGGAFITFSHEPQVMRVGGPDDKRSFEEKVNCILSSNWSMNTDFVAVFEKLILPMAIENNLSQDEMVKQVFVFSDMQFDSASGDDRWTTSYERIKKKFKNAGYEMPKLIFWNLAGGRAGYGDTSTDGGDDKAPKPVTAAEEGTALVSGYSQGQLKMFLDNGSFEDPEAEEVVEEKEEPGTDEVVVEKVRKKQDPLSVVRKAISHPAYGMLKVVD